MLRRVSSIGGLLLDQVVSMAVMEFDRMNRIHYIQYFNSSDWAVVSIFLAGLCRSRVWQREVRRHRHWIA